MNRSTLARRYAPLFLLAAVQLLIIATVPSTASKQAAAQVTAGFGAGGGSGGGGGTAGSAGGTASGATGSASGAGGLGGTTGDTGTGTGSTGSAGGLGATGATGSTGSGTTGGGAALPPGAASGDTSHCKGGREFDPGIAYFAPQCAPGSPGGPYANNGGATSMGVTGNQITVVDYNGDDGAEVDAILKAEGLYESYANAQVLDAAYQNFINKEYVLYGRKVKIVTYQGQCTLVPPDTNCLIPEMDKIAAQYHPYAVVWGNNTLCSACYAELARDRVVTIGGVGFSDDFSNQNAPYFYTVSESSTRIEKAFADFYCKQLARSPVKFAETLNAAQNFNGKPRVLGILSTNDPDNENTVKQVLVPALKQECGVSVNHFYFYAQDINTAAQQVAAGIAAMDTPTNPATSVLCLCDAVAPEFLFEGEKANNYFPENLLASDQGMDLDKAAQAYMSGLACPGGNQCEFDLAFGIGPDGPEEPSTNDYGDRMYKLGGGANLPVDPTVNGVFAEDYGLLANLLENTGPDLTPPNMQARAPALATAGGGATGQALLALGAGDWQWQQDARVEYWSKTTTSSYNGQPGTFISIEGNRFNIGQYPTLTEPPVPPRPN
jgi:hypothetical protein